MPKKRKPTWIITHIKQRQPNGEMKEFTVRVEANIHPIMCPGFEAPRDVIVDIETWKIDPPEGELILLTDLELELVKDELWEKFIDDRKNRGEDD